MLLVRADFSLRALVTPYQYQWIPSPQSGVERVMLDRVGGEKGQATSIVRYHPGASFPAHVHPGGEEILVLSGVFSEGGTDYPSGSYLRNEPGSSHQPHSPPGAVIFVKLGQMALDEREPVRINTGDDSAWTDEAGERVCCLYRGAAETTCLQAVAPLDPVLKPSVAGLVEVLVVKGSLVLESSQLPEGSWLRLPDGDRPLLVAGQAGATVYLRLLSSAAFNRELTP